MNEHEVYDPTGVLTAAIVESFKETDMWRPPPYILGGNHEECDRCHGTGLAKSSKKIPCIWCEGKGYKEPDK